jgi:hypothetical protein
MYTPAARANVVGIVEPSAPVGKESRLGVGMRGVARRETDIPYIIHNKIADRRQAGVPT